MKRVLLGLVVAVMFVQGASATYYFLLNSGGGSVGNVSSVNVSYGIQNVGTSTEPVLTIDNATVCTKDNALCNGTGTGGGNFSVWRVGADTGVSQNVTNNTLVRFLSGSGISTNVIAGPDITISNDGILSLGAGDGLSSTGGQSPSLSVDSTVCRSDGTNCPGLSASGSTNTFYDVLYCDGSCNTVYDGGGT